MSDTSNLYIKTKIALANSNFIVKDNYNFDTVTTHPKKLDFINAYMVTTAIISTNTITFSAIYGLSRLEFWDYTRMPNNYSRVIYYNTSKTWRTLMDIAIKMQGEISFDK